MPKAQTKLPMYSAPEMFAMMKGGSLDLNASMRAMAMNTGQFSVLVMREVTQVMQAKRNSRTRSMQVGVDRLLSHGHISAQEAKELKTVVRLVLGATRADADLAKSSQKLCEIYQSMICAANSSPVALAIASAANSALAIPQARPGRGRAAVGVEIIPGNAGVGAVVGGVIGGVIGGIAGGGLGAGLGATVGAAAGAAIGYCNEKGV